MRKLTTFNFITLNGFFKGPGEDISWHKDGNEEKEEYAEDKLQQDNILVFGRVTYEMMAAFWPSPMAAETMPVVAEGMNRSEKIVFSRTLEKAEWNNTRLIKDNIIETVRKMKQEPGKGMTILGSGSIITQFAEAGLIDEYQFMIDPLAIGEGTPIFKNIRQPLHLTLTRTEMLKGGVVLLTYRPA